MCNISVYKHIRCNADFHNAFLIEHNVLFAFALLIKTPDLFAHRSGNVATLYSLKYTLIFHAMK